MTFVIRPTLTRTICFCIGYSLASKRGVSVCFCMCVEGHSRCVGIEGKSTVFPLYVTIADGDAVLSVSLCRVRWYDRPRKKSPSTFYCFDESFPFTDTRRQYHTRCIIVDAANLGILSCHPQLCRRKM